MPTSQELYLAGKQTETRHGITTIPVPEVQDFSEQEAQLAALRQQLAQEQEANAKYQQQLNNQRRTLQNPNLLRKAGLGNLVVDKQARYSAIKNVGQAGQQIEARNVELQQFKSQTIEPAEAQISQARAEQTQARQQIMDYNDAATAYNTNDPRRLVGNSNAQKFYDEFTRTGISTQPAPITEYYIPGIGGVSVPPGGRPPLGAVPMPQGGIPPSLTAQDLFNRLGINPPTVIAGTGQEKLYQALGVEYQIASPNQLVNLDVSKLGGIYGTELRGTAITAPPGIPLSAYQPPPITPSSQLISVEAPSPPPSLFYPEGFPAKEEITKFTDIEKIIPNVFPRYYYEKEKIKSKYLTAEKVSKDYGIPIEFAGLGEFAGGVVSAGVALGIEYPLYGLLRPITTAKGLLGLPKEAISGFPTISEQVAPEFATRPGYATGFFVTALVGTVGRAPGKIEITRAGYIPKITAIPDEFTLKLPTFTELIRQPLLSEAKQEVPSPNIKDYIETSLRNRPTARESTRILLKDSKGNYILDESGAESSKVISFGGDMKKGETPNQGALRELREEITKKYGLRIEDLKYEGKQVFPEEIFHVFTKTLSDSEIARLKDVRIVSPSEAKGITGQSRKYPYTKDNIRVYELALINWIETGQEPTWLYTQTKVGKEYYGTQSRYDITEGAITAYATGDELALTHGTTELPVVQRIFKKGIEVLEKKSKRGEKGMYVSPPVSAKEIPADVKKLIGYTGEGDFVIPKEFKELPFEVPTQPSPGYIPLSYVIPGAGGKYLLGFKNPFKSRGVFLFKEKLAGAIRFTGKALSGGESEAIIEVGTKIETTLARQPEYIGGYRFLLQPARILESELRKTTISNVNKIISKSEPVLETRTPRIRYTYQPTKETAFEFAKMDEKKVGKEINFQDKGLEVTSEKYFGDKYLGELISYEPEIPFGYKYKTSYTPDIPKYPPYTPRIPELFPRITIIGKKKKKEEYFKQGKRAPAYSVFLKRKGKFVPVRTGLPRGMALKYGASQVEKELSRQFKILPFGTTTTEDIFFKPSEQVFRPYKVRRGQKVLLEPNRFIQKQRYALASVEERRLIAQAKKEKGLMKGILA